MAQTIISRRGGGGHTIEKIIVGGNSGGTGRATIQVNKKLAVLSGSGDGYDSVGGSLDIWVNGSQIRCSDTNGTLISRTQDSGNDKKSSLLTWINNKTYKDETITQARYNNNRSDGSANIAYFTYE